MTNMVSLKFMVLFLATLVYFLDDVSAVTCYAAPQDPNCIDCSQYPSHVHCLVGISTTVPPTHMIKRQCLVPRICNVFEFVRAVVLRFRDLRRPRRIY
ncbi:uncharacterized protein LOC117897110 [Drosophila subobscura]|uniref:uncharacterized protein LOC117897110 n=1 Tax=Drosophila subobscura TaxID=7241 RepID=UPI00155B360A|nr:uncharacterized protein LOC117897110 [Drosophila subobscura]